MREVTSGIFEIDTRPLGRRQVVASFLIQGSDKTALIDPGFPSSARSVVNEIESAGIDPRKIDYLVQTHAHIDHAGATGQLALISNKATVVAHKRGAFYLKNSGKITGGAKIVFGSEISDELGDAVDTPEDRILTVGDGDSIDPGDKRLQVFYTPGHSGDHISLFEEATGTLFPGDTACLHYPQLGHVLIPAGSPPIYRSDYIIEELQNLSQLNIRTILTPHYGEVHLDPDAFMARNVQVVKDSRIKIEKMFSEGLEFPQVIEKLRADIIGDSGFPREEIPDFLADVWLRWMLKSGLMGYMADILQYAKDIRPFNESAPEGGSR